MAAFAAMAATAAAGAGAGGEPGPAPVPDSRRDRPASPRGVCTLDETLDGIADGPRPGARRLLHDRPDRGRAASVGQRDGPAGPSAAAVEAGPRLAHPGGCRSGWRARRRAGGQEPRFYERRHRRGPARGRADEEDFEFLRWLGVRSGGHGRVAGPWPVDRDADDRQVGSGRRYRPDDVHFARVLAGRVALALDNAGLFADLERAERERAEIAETLQRGLMPPPLPHIPGWSLAAMYRPAGAENEVGGDFYDAFRIGGGWMVVIGDVTGRGAQAASVTALARYTLRTAAALTGDPVIALETLNRACSRAEARALQCRRAGAQRGPGQPVRMAVAGHLPPLLVDGGGERGAPAAPVLGAFPDAGGGSRRPGRGRPAAGGGHRRDHRGGGRGRPLRRAAAAHASWQARAVRHLRCRGSRGPARLHRGPLDDDAAILAVAPSGAGRRRRAAARVAERRALVERLFDAFNRATPRRSAGCARGDGVFPSGTAEEVGATPRTSGQGDSATTSTTSSAASEELLMPPTVASSHGNRCWSGAALRPQPRARDPRHAGRLDLAGPTTASSSAARSSPTPRRPSPPSRPTSVEASQISRGDHLHQPVQERHPYRDRREDLEDHRVPARQAGQGRRLRADQAAADRGRRR